MAVRNINIDTTEISKDVLATAIDWSVSQGKSVSVGFISCPRSAGEPMSGRHDVVALGCKANLLKCN